MPKRELPQIRMAILHDSDSGELLKPHDVQTNISKEEAI